MWWLLIIAALPERELTFKTETASFGAQWEIALDDGKLFWRRRGSTQWALLPPDGLPAPKGRLEALKELAADLPLAPEPFVRPARITRLSADGDNLLAVSDTGVGYYTKLTTLEWSDDWGPVGVRAPLRLGPELAAFAMSHRKIPYEDLDGNPHPVSAGVTTVYSVVDGGRRLAYADPWLPPGWSRTLCLPERNTFVASAVSASASTLFLMDASGRSFTRLADFDTIGDDPALPYSWTRARRRGAEAVIRTLPGEEWRAQPRIPGRHGLRITITQTGSTNAARKLVVEGDGGHWEKAIFEPEWTFVSDGGRIERPLSPGPPPRQPSHESSWRSEQKVLGEAVRLEGLDVDCSPATLVVGDERFPLHFHGGLDLRRRTAALLLPKTRSRIVLALRALAAGRDVLELDVDVGDELVLSKKPSVEWRFSKAGTTP